MKIGMIGLGLIGGSMAKSLKENTEHTVAGWDIVETVRYHAKLCGAVDQFLLEGDPSDCDMVIIALYPKQTLAYLEEHQADFKKGAVVVDCCGIKTRICKKGFALAKQHGFQFVGGHPMAGIERSGFTFSSAALFKNATMILTPEKQDDLNLLNDLSFLFRAAGFGTIKISSWEEHDRMIAYTSQLAHVVSSAYIKNDLSHQHKGFSAGSFQDMTRVAKLNEVMWTDLFLENREPLLEELDELIERLNIYSAAIRDRDSEGLKKLLREGRERRQAIEEEPEFD